MICGGARSPASPELMLRLINAASVWRRWRSARGIEGQRAGQRGPPGAARSAAPAQRVRCQILRTVAPRNRARKWTRNLFPASPGGGCPAVGRCCRGSGRNPTHEASARTGDSRQDEWCSGCRRSISQEQVCGIKTEIQAQQKFLGELVEQGSQWCSTARTANLFFAEEPHVSAELLDRRVSL